ALAIAPSNPRANRAAASFYIETGRAAEAEPYVKAATEHKNDVDARLRLADYYLGIGRSADATAILTDLRLAREGYAAATTRLAMIAFASGRRDRADTLADEVLRKEPKNAAALIVKARLLLADR